MFVSPGTSTIPYTALGPELVQVLPDEGDVALVEGALLLVARERVRDVLGTLAAVVAIELCRRLSTP